MPMDQYRGAPYNPFAPTLIGGSPVDEARIPQIENPQAITPVTEESTMDKIGDVALEKGGNVAADKGGDMLTNALAGGKGGTAPFTAGAKAAGPMGYLQTAAGNTVGGAATGAAASGGALAGMGAAIAPVLPFVIGAMALKSIFKK